MYDLIIIGGGPAGVSAGVYAARKKLKTLVITDSFGGQSIVSDDIQNWIGIKSVSGLDLAKMFEDHLRAQDGIEIIDGDLVVSVEKTDSGFKVMSRNNRNLETKTILVASGSGRRKLGISGEKEFEGKGVVYCSTCDAPVFKNKTVAVVGGGNAGLEAVVDLLPYAEKIYLLERNGKLNGDAKTQEEIKDNSKVEIILHAEPVEVSGNQFLNGLKYKNTNTGKEETLGLDGVFVEIGISPNTEFMKNLVRINESGEIVVDHKTQRSSLDGIWAAGDASDVLYKQNNISAGDAIKAVLNIYGFLQEKEKTR
jgi:alkyl hydroperoxide reductase subunit F